MIGSAHDFSRQIQDADIAFGTRFNFQFALPKLDLMELTMNTCFSNDKARHRGFQPRLFPPQIPLTQVMCFIVVDLLKTHYFLGPIRLGRAALCPPSTRSLIVVDANLSLNCSERDGNHGFAG